MQLHQSTATQTGGHVSKKFGDIPGGVLLSFGIHKGRRGQLIEAWKIRCAQVHMAKITAWDGGGLAVYSSNHPAAREFSARQAEVRWNGTSDKSSLIGARYKEHANAVDDWIPFDSYSSVRDISKGKVSLQRSRIPDACLC